MENINVLKMFGFGAVSRKVRWQQLKTGWNTGSGAIKRSLPGGSDGKASVCNAEDPGLIPGSGRSLEKEMATHSSTLAWRIPWTEEPGRLQSLTWGRKETDTNEWPYVFLCYPGYHWLSISSFSNWKDLLHTTKIHWRVLKLVQRQNSRILATEANRYQITIFPFIHVRLYI